jgi:hypothetical protein
MADEVRWSNVNGVLRMIDENGNEAVCGDRTPTPEEEAAYRQEMAAADLPREEDVQAYEDLKWSDPDFETVRDEMQRLAGEVAPEDAARINTNHRAFVEEYKALKTAMVGAEVDAPRHRAIAALREQLAGEGANSGRRREIERRILGLHGGGR